MQKRSLTIAGHRTSIALEAEFWQVLDAMAREAALSLPQLIAHIDAETGARNLTSALRVAALGFAQGRTIDGVPVMSVEGSREGS